MVYLDFPKILNTVKIHTVAKKIVEVIQRWILGAVT
jgi:hypothetical protein